MGTILWLVPLLFVAFAKTINYPIKQMNHENQSIKVCNPVIIHCYGLG